MKKSRILTEKQFSRWTGYAVRTHGTSVAGNPWKPFDADKDETTLIPLSQGFEVYDWLNCPESV